MSWCPQRDKSTGSGLVLAVPAMVLDCQTAIPGAGPQVVTGAEYENLVTDNQYYEQVSRNNSGSRPRHETVQVEFGKHVLGARVPRVQDSDSLYSIPQVAASSASASSATSTTRLTASLVKVSGN